MLNLADLLELSAERAPGDTAIIYDTLRMSYSDLLAAVKRVAHILRSKGLGRGDVVGMMLPNTPHFPIIYYGILYMGGVALPMNPTLRGREIAYQLGDARAKAFFVWKDCVEEAGKALSSLPECRHLVVVEPGMLPVRPAVGESFVELLMTAEAEGEIEIEQTEPGDTAVIIYTSSLGGKTYGAELTHFNLHSNATAIREYVVRFDPGDVTLVVLPLFHAFGQTTMMNVPLLGGSTILLVPRFDPQHVLQLMQKEGVTLACVVPTMLYFLVQAKKEEKYDFSALRCVIVGGAKMSVDVARKFEERFKVDVLEGYGLTETGPVVSFNRAGMNRPGSVGNPLWGCRVRVQRADGSFAKPGEIGEVVLRGHNVMKGYLNAPEATAHVMEGGWFHTGDWGYLDEDGYLFLTGLKKDIIIRAGLNIYPSEVEGVLKDHPSVLDAAVVGIPDVVRGEEPKAFLVPRPGQTIDAKEMAAYCRQELASYKCPRTFEEIAELPRDASGEVRKDVLRAQPL